MNEPEPSEESLFLAACRLTDLAQRAAFLDAQCRGSAELRRRLDQLLAERSEADAYFDKPPAGARAASPAATAAIAKTPSLQEVVAPPLVATNSSKKSAKAAAACLHGRAGGTDSPKVALKVIKLGMDTRAVIARFEASGRRWR
jgi:hypothetical protein